VVTRHKISNDLKAQLHNSMWTKPHFIIKSKMIQLMDGGGEIGRQGVAEVEQSNTTSL
jgi:hypothetical protein